MGRGRAAVSIYTVDADEAHRFFDNKVAGVRVGDRRCAATFLYTTAPTTCQLDDFRRQSTDEVLTAMRLLPAEMVMGWVHPPNPTQPNPTHGIHGLGWVGLGWVRVFFNFWWVGLGWVET